jgi:hypothetical protein
MRRIEAIPRSIRLHNTSLLTAMYFSRLSRLFYNEPFRYKLSEGGEF